MKTAVQKAAFWTIARNTKELVSRRGYFSGYLTKLEVDT